MLLNFRAAMSGLLNSGLNASSNLPDSSERAYTTAYSAQSGNLLGLHSAHGSYNIPNMAGTYASRNAAANGGPSSGVQQAAGSIGNGRFTMNNLPASLSQPSPGSSHAHSGITNNGGLSQNLGNGGRLINSVGNLVSGANVGRSLSSGAGLNMPGAGSRLNLTAPQMVSMLGNSFSAGGGQLSQNHFRTGNNHLALLNELSRDHASFDINDFPQLTGQPNSASGSQGQLGLSRKQGVGFLQQNQEFSMQNEDFPALPGYKGGGSSEFQGNMHQKEQLHESVMSMMQSRHLPVGRSSGFNIGGSYPSHHQQQQQHAQSVTGGGLSFLPANNQDIQFNSSEVRSSGLPASGSRPANLSNAISGVGSYDQLIQQYEHFQKQSQFRSGSTFRDQDSKSGQALQGTADRFGLLGLLSVIRMSNPDLTSLALGIDLMTLGLNLNSSEILNKKFASPWSEEPAKGEPHFSVPECFNSKQLPALNQAFFSRFRQETLFYIFYSMPKEEAQLYAANELHTRGWFYHREFHLWFIRVPKMEPLVKTNTYERGCYFCFDPNSWETTRKDNFVVQYEMVEKRPVLPRQ